MNADLLTPTLAQVGDEIDGPPAGNSGNDAVEGQDGGNGDAGTQGNQDSGGLFGGSMFWIIMLGMIVLWIFLIGGGSRKQKKRQAEMLASMTKGSKVVTIGGIKGSVVEVRDDEVLVKVDESANTRLRFSRDAIRSVTDGSPSSS